MGSEAFISSNVYSNKKFGTHQSNIDRYTLYGRPSSQKNFPTFCLEHNKAVSNFFEQFQSLNQVNRTCNNNSNDWIEMGEQFQSHFDIPKIQQIMRRKQNEWNEPVQKYLNCNSMFPILQKSIAKNGIYSEADPMIDWSRVKTFNDLIRLTERKLFLDRFNQNDLLKSKEVVVSTKVIQNSGYNKIIFNNKQEVSTIHERINKMSPIKSTVFVLQVLQLQKVDSLKRCLVYRLGRRLPMKGPGFVCRLPFIDQMTMIDLADTPFDIVLEDKQILTSDGSIVLFKPFEATLSVINSVLTTLKVQNVDVKQLIRVRFENMIHATHVEDLENKMDFNIRMFEENCNRILKDWGHSIKIGDLPRMTVIERADPINPIKTKLERFFNQTSGDNGEDPNNSSSEPMSSFESMLGNLLGNQHQSNPKVTKLEHLDGVTVSSVKPAPNPIQNHDDILLNLLNHQVDKDKVAQNRTKPSEPIKLDKIDLDNVTPVLQKLVDDNSRMIPFHRLNLKLLIENEDNLSDPRYEQYFQFHNGKIKCLDEQPKTVRLTVRFSHYQNFNQFIHTGDLQFLKYQYQ